MKIYKEKAGVISPDPVWICYHSCYMYTGDTLLELFVDMFKNWNSDSHLIG